MAKYIIELSDDQAALLERDAQAEFRTPELQMQYRFHKAGIAVAGVSKLVAELPPVIRVKKHTRRAPDRGALWVRFKTYQDRYRRLEFSAALLRQMKSPAYVVVAWHGPNSITIRPDNGTAKLAKKVSAQKHVSLDLSFSKADGHVCTDFQFDGNLVVVYFPKEEAAS